MAIADKLTSLNTAKNSIKQSLINKGIDVSNKAFTEWNTVIDSASSGSIESCTCQITISSPMNFPLFVCYTDANLSSNSAEVMLDNTITVAKGTTITIYGWTSMSTTMGQITMMYGSNNVYTFSVSGDCQLEYWG